MNNSNPDLLLPERYLHVLQELFSRHVPDDHVWAYGSRVNGTAHEGSDLDVVILNGRDPDAEIEGLINLRTAIEETTLPILVDIHAWSELPQWLRADILKRHVVLYRT